MSLIERFGYDKKPPVNDRPLFDPSASGQFAPFDLVHGDMQSDEHILYNLDNTALHAWGMVMGLGLSFLRRMSYAQKATVFRMCKSETEHKMQRKNSTLGARYPYKYDQTNGYTVLRYGNGGHLPYVKEFRGDMVAIRFGNRLHAIDANGAIIANKRL